MNASTSTHVASLCLLYPPPLLLAAGQARSCPPGCGRWSSVLPQWHLSVSCRCPLSSCSLCHSQKHCTQTGKIRKSLADMIIIVCICICQASYCMCTICIVLYYVMFLSNTIYLLHISSCDECNKANNYFNVIQNLYWLCMNTCASPG